MGILNITPDSFSDGGIHTQADAVLKTITRWLSEGVRIVDLGAESTRPSAIAISPQDEWRRLAPILEALQDSPLVKNEQFILSLDTRNPETAALAVQRGIHWLNDVSGFDNPQLTRIAADAGTTAIFMHSLSVPARSDVVISDNQQSIDAVDAILKWAEKKIQNLMNQGIPREKLIFDPGLGFGKTQAQNWDIIRRFRKFHELGVKTLVGHSRKSFLAALGSQNASDRDPETAAVSIDLCAKGVDLLRVHDPVLNARALRAWSLSNGVVQCED